MVIVIGSQKGGCGKSTLAVNLAVGFALNKLSVLLLDADKQATASNWAQYREDVTGLVDIECIQRFGNIHKTILNQAKRFDVVIVDIAGRDSPELRTAMGVADILIIPFRPSQPDLDTLPRIYSIVDEMKTAINEDLKVYALLTMAPTNPVINEVEESRSILADYPDLLLSENVIRDRKVYRDSMAEGKGVLEMSNLKAKTEINQLIEEIKTW